MVKKASAASNCAQPLHRDPGIKTRATGRPVIVRQSNRRSAQQATATRNCQAQRGLECHPGHYSGVMSADLPGANHGQRTPAQG